MDGIMRAGCIWVRIWPRTVSFVQGNELCRWTGSFQLESQSWSVKPSKRNSVWTASLFETSESNHPKTQHHITRINYTTMRALNLTTKRRRFPH